MKLVRFATIVAVTGVAQVFAAPHMVITTIIPDNAFTPKLPVGVGHQVPDRFVRPQVLPNIRRPCHGGHPNRFKQKAVELSNFFRQALGLPLIAGGHPGPAHDGARILFIGTPGSRMELGPNFRENPHPRPHHHHRPHPGPHPHHRLGQGDFLGRINYSLMNLGRWEGRAVAFVLGCGIGVLIRMIFVLGLVMYRAVKGRRGEEHEYSQITIIEQVAPKSAPPAYTFPVDEKVPIETVQAPTNSAEETK